jgi:hypothetical protein
MREREWEERGGAELSRVWAGSPVHWAPYMLIVEPGPTTSRFASSHAMIRVCDFSFFTRIGCLQWARPFY